jgi:hypothetical protein
MEHFFKYGSKIIVIKTCLPGEGDMQVGVGDTQVAALDNLEAIAIPGHLAEIEGLKQALHLVGDSTMDANELEEIEPEDKEDVTKWVSVASFVSTFPNGDRDGACDVAIQVGRSGGGWYLRSINDAGGDDDCDDTAYKSKGEAIAAAQVFAEANNKGNAGENASAFLTRQLREAAGTPCNDGEYCVYWASTREEDCHVSVRYETAEQAEAAAELSNQQLAVANPGRLLCGYEVRQMVSVGGHMVWVKLDEE